MFMRGFSWKLGLRQPDRRAFYRNGLALSCSLSIAAGLCGCGGDVETDVATVDDTDETQALGGKSHQLTVAKDVPAPELEAAEVPEADEKSLQVVVVADADGDGRMSKEEFMARMAARDAERAPEPALSPKERRRLLERELRQPGQKGKRIALLNKFDHDGDGAFSTAEKAEAQAYLDEQKQLKTERNRLERSQSEVDRAAGE